MIGLLTLGVRFKALPIKVSPSFFNPYLYTLHQIVTNKSLPGILILFMILSLFHMLE